MSNASANLVTETLGDGPFIFDLPVKASTAIYKGTIICQHSGGYAVPLTTSGGGAAIGVAQHSVTSTAVDGSKRIRVETMRAYAFTNGAGGDAFAETSKVGAPVYATDDHTVADNSNAGANPCIGYFLGFESDGKVRVFMNPGFAYLVNALNVGLLGLTDTPATADALRDNIVSVIGTALL
jgi:predicted RecA/RadA family phage recombinase